MKWTLLIRASLHGRENDLRTADDETLVLDIAYEIGTMALPDAIHEIARVVAQLWVMEEELAARMVVIRSDDP